MQNTVWLQLYSSVYEKDTDEMLANSVKPDLGMVMWVQLAPYIWPPVSCDWIGHMMSHDDNWTISMTTKKTPSADEDGEMQLKHLDISYSPTVYLILCVKHVLKPTNIKGYRW